MDALPPFLALDAATASRPFAEILAEAYKPSKGELDFGLINNRFDARERIAVYRKARATPGRLVTVGRYSMLYLGH
jgi:hypothetical protein